MSLSDRRTFLTGLAALSAVGGCGFRPAYGPGGVAEGMRGRIAVDAPDTELAFALVERLETRLGRPQAALYQLSYRIETEARGLGITAEQETTRYNLTGTVRFQLRDAGTGAVAQSGEVDGFTSYSATGSTVATLAAERDAERRLMVMLADQLVTRLIATAGAWAP